MKSYYIIYKCFTTRNERVEQWYGRIPAMDDTAAKLECRKLWAKHQGDQYKKEIMLLDGNKDTMFEYRTHPKGSIPLMM